VDSLDRGSDSVGSVPAAGADVAGLAGRLRRSAASARRNMLASLLVIWFAWIVSMFVCLRATRQLVT